MADSKWLTKRAVTAHIAIIIWFPGCLVAAWWQVTIALAGDSLGWLYSVEWPIFALFGLVFWWNIIHDDPNKVGHKGLVLARKQMLTTSATDQRTPDNTDSLNENTVADKDQNIQLSGIDLAHIRLEAESDDEMAAYNEYLANLSEKKRKK